MYCPKCKCEYKDGITSCPDCNVKLIGHATEESVELIEAINPIKVESVANAIHAELIMNLLLDNNIPCFRKSKGAGGYMNIYMGYSIFGEDIYVDKKDYQVAKDLLKELAFDDEQINEEQIDDEQIDDEQINEEQIDEEQTQEEEFDVEESQLDYHIPFYKRPQIVARIMIVVIVLTVGLSYILNNIA